MLKLWELAATLSKSAALSSSIFFRALPVEREFLCLASWGGASFSSSVLSGTVDWYCFTILNDIYLRREECGRYLWCGGAPTTAGRFESFFCIRLFRRSTRSRVFEVLAPDPGLFLVAWWDISNFLSILKIYPPSEKDENYLYILFQSEMLSNFYRRSTKFERIFFDFPSWTYFSRIKRKAP